MLEMDNEVVSFQPVDMGKAMATDIAKSLGTLIKSRGGMVADVREEKLYKIILNLDVKGIEDEKLNELGNIIKGYMDKVKDKINLSIIIKDTA